MHFDGVAFDLGIEGVQLFLKLGFRQKLTGAGQQCLKKRPFAGGQRHRLAVAAQAARGKVDVKAAVADDPSTWGQSGPATRHAKRSISQQTISMA